MEPLILENAVCPHKNMPTEIRKAFFEACREWDLSNNSFLHWTVGEYSNQNEESDFGHETFCREVDGWLLTHFNKGEVIIILHWW